MNKYYTFELNGFNFPVEVKGFRVCGGDIQAKVKMLIDEHGEETLWVSVLDLKPHSVLKRFVDEGIDFNTDNGKITFPKTESGDRIKEILNSSK